MRLEPVQPPWSRDDVILVKIVGFFPEIPEISSAPQAIAVLDKLIAAICTIGDVSAKCAMDSVEAISNFAAGPQDVIKNHFVLISFSFPHPSCRR